MDLSNKENLLPQIVKTRIVKKEQQESVLRDAPKSTFDSYKKAQVKMKQLAIQAPAQKRKECIRILKLEKNALQKLL